MLEDLRVIMERVFAVAPHAMQRQIYVTLEPVNVEVQVDHVILPPDSQRAWTVLP